MAGTDDSYHPGQVVPSLFVDSVEKERSFYIDKLGFSHRMGLVGRDGSLDFCIVTRGATMIMFARPPERREGTAEAWPTARPLELYIRVDDVDALHADVTGRGVAAHKPLTDQWWGDRNFAVRDPYGYLVWFNQTVHALDTVRPPAGVTIV
jgi:PhnB protein